jgi:ATP-binding cassette subfamily F protein uup
VELVNVGVSIPRGDSQRWLFRHLDLSLRPGQCTGIVGRNGVGKTTLLRICLGQQEPSEGSATIGKRVVFNYIDQSRAQLNGVGTVMEEIGGTSGMVRFGTQMLTVRSYLRRFLFDESRVNERVDKLSGGERARLMLAKTLCRGGNVIVLDEPTNDLDLSSLRMLEEAIADFDGAVLVVSHDRYFLDRICDQIVAFEDDGVIVQPGNYSYYLEKRQAREQRDKLYAAAAAKEAAARQKAAANPAKPRKLTLAERKELEGIEDVIHAAEAKVAEIEALLNDPDFQLNRFAEVPEIVTKLEAAKAHVHTLFTRWEELEALAAQ